MTIPRTYLVLVLFVVFVCPFLILRLIWLSDSVATNGTKYFTGHGNVGSVLGLSTYPLIQFTVGNDTIEFKGNMNIPMEDGQRVPIRYQHDDPSDARINTFKGMWADVAVYSAGPFMVFLALLFTPGLIPRYLKIGRPQTRNDST